MSRRILVAEPSPTLTTLIRLTLARDDTVLDFVSDGRDALEKARQWRPDLIIAAASLPGLDGYALTEAIRRDRALEDLPVLLTVNDREAANIERTNLVGVSDVLTKPFERHALVERVRALVAHRPEISRQAPAERGGADSSTQQMVDERLAGIVQDPDLSRYIL